MQKMRNTLDLVQIAVELIKFRGTEYIIIGSMGFIMENLVQKDGFLISQSFFGTTGVCGDS